MCVCVWCCACLCLAVSVRLRMSVCLCISVCLCVSVCLCACLSLAGPGPRVPGPRSVCVRLSLPLFLSPGSRSLSLFLSFFGDKGEGRSNPPPAHERTPAVPGATWFRLRIYHRRLGFTRTCPVHWSVSFRPGALGTQQKNSKD